MKTTKKLCSLLLIAVLPLGAACSNTAKQEEEETMNNLLMLSLLSAATRASAVASSTCATSSGSATSITATGTNTSTFVLASRGLCFLKFTAPGNTNYTVQLTSVVGDTDLAVGNVGATATYGTSPSSFWPSGSGNCTGYAWNTCVSTSSSPESVNSIPMTVGQQVGIGVYGYNCVASTGCQFRVVVN